MGVDKNTGGSKRLLILQSKNVSQKSRFVAMQHKNTLQLILTSVSKFISVLLKVQIFRASGKATFVDEIYLFHISK